ncbi:ribonuclease H-like domain-containing protein [Tanacetum coccineum]|uniref:Ribonuclease H-like domain-containing protein n=1 Tax=Tanacetum coccineum TaxID=301880 RepID=A0ABQ5CHV1_9ASTR
MLHSQWPSGCCSRHNHKRFELKAIDRDHDEISFQSSAVLPSGKNCAMKRVVRSSQVEMDPAGRRSSQLIAWSQREKWNRRKRRHHISTYGELNSVPIALVARYVVPTGRVVVPAGRYIVLASKVILIVSTSKLSLVPTGRVLSPGSDNDSDDASVHSEATIPQQQRNIQPQIITTVSNNNAKFPYLKKDEYERTGRDHDGRVIILPPTTANEHIVVQRESKARTTLLQSIPDDHVADFHYMDDARDIWNAVKARFGGNAESKKMRKSMLKQEFLEFRISEAEGLHKGYDRMQKILSQLNQLKAKPEDEDINLKFLRALPSSWSQVALTLKTKGGLELLSFDDLYYKLKTLEVDIKGYSTFSLSQSVGPSHSAFVSTASASKKMSYADSPSYTSSTYTVPSNSKTGSHRSGNIEKLDLEEMDLKWKMAMLSVRVHKFEQKAGRKIDFDKKESARFNKKKALTLVTYYVLELTAVRTACYRSLKECLVTSPHNKTPYALLTGNIPSVSHFKPFGCHVTILNTSDHLGKFDGKADEGYIVGYSASNKAYRVYNVPTKRVEETMNLRYLEEKPNVQGLGHEWYFDLDYLTDSLGYKHDKANQSAGTHEASTNPAGTQDADSDSECDEQVIIIPFYPSHNIQEAEPKDISSDEVADSPLDSAKEIFQKELARMKGREQRATSDAKDTEELQERASTKSVPTG